MPKIPLPPVTLAFAAGLSVGLALVQLAARFRRPDKINAARGRLWNIVGESFSGALILTGDQLDLYELLFQAGPITALALAKKTGWSERFLLEWLSQSAAAGILTYNETSDEFAIKEEYAQLLRDPSKAEESMVGLFTMSNALVGRASALTKAIQTGVGVDYDFGDDVTGGIDRKNWNYFHNKFSDEVLAKTTIPSTGRSLLAMLEEGIAVADVGCGYGASTVAMAVKFPKSSFYAYEISPRSLDVIRKRVKDFDLKNLIVCDVTQRGVGDGPDAPHTDFGFVYAHDVLHDMTTPRALIADVKKRLAPGGCWIIVDVVCGGSTAENLRMSSAPTKLGFSCLLCLSSAMSTADGEGLGTMGFSIGLAQQWMKEAGFAHCVPIKFPSLPDNQGFLVG